MEILVLGYYNRGNLGDETYKIVMAKYLPQFQLQFVCIDDINSINVSAYKGLIVGGGDIVNDYFYGKLNPILKKFTGFKIALSIGIPFPDCITKKYFGKYDHIFVRNCEDIRALQRVVGTNKSHCLPDLAFLLDRPLPPLEGREPVNLVIKKPKPKCGFFLVQNLINFPFVVENLIKLVKEISQTYDVVFYLFNTFSNKEENDYDVSEKVAVSAGLNPNEVIDTKTYDPIELLNLIANLDFAVCLRFHAHIFCMLAGVPFISISSTRKTRSLMKTAGLGDYQYQIKLNANWTPIESDYVKLKATYDFAQNNPVIMKYKIDAFVSKCKMLLDHQQVKFLIEMCSTKSTSEHIHSFISQYQNYDNAARLMSSMTVGYPDSGYIWGIYDKLYKRVPNAIESSVNYLEKTIKKEENKFFLFDWFFSKIPIWIDVPEFQSYKDAHRGGWYLTIENLAKRMTSTGILCDMYVDRTFHWCENYSEYTGKIPYTVPWCGFIHHTDNTTYSKNNLSAMLKNKLFIQSLNNCVCLFTLAPSLSIRLEKLLTGMGFSTKIKTLTHPIVMPELLFNPSNLKSGQTNLIQIGTWLRNYFTIYTLHTKNFNKSILAGPGMKGLTPDENFDIKHISELEDDIKKCHDKNGCRHHHPIHPVHPIHPCRPEPCPHHCRPHPIHPCRHEHPSHDPRHPIHPCRLEPGSLPRLIMDIVEWLEHNLKIIEMVYFDHKLYIGATTKYIEQHAINQVKQMLNTVKIIPKLDNKEYDKLLSKSVCFCHLIDSAAINTVIECIVRNTPILINKTPGVLDLLGPDYPLYFDEKLVKEGQNIDDVLTKKNIKKTYTYLKSLDKSKFKIDHFVDSFTDIIKEIDSKL
jgi:polysaccharide pyruvyl transferase WcaK-like protein